MTDRQPPARAPRSGGRTPQAAGVARPPRGRAEATAKAAKPKGAAPKAARGPRTPAKNVAATGTAYPSRRPRPTRPSAAAAPPVSAVYRRRRLVAVLGALVIVAGLAFALARLTAPAPAPSTTAIITPSVVAPPPTAAATSTLGTLPAVKSTSASAIDWRLIRSLTDLPAAVQCRDNVTPITIPASGTTPAAVACASKLADDETLYFWYAGTPDERYRAITAAMATMKYVHAGPNWVAGGMVTATMGRIGGDVYQ